MRLSAPFYNLNKDHEFGFYLVPTWFTILLSSIMLLIGVICCAYAIVYGVIIPESFRTEETIQLSAKAVPCGIILLLLGGVINKIEVITKLTFRNKRPSERKIRKRHRIHRHTELGVQHNCAKVLQEKLFDNSSVLLAENIEMIFLYLSYGQQKSHLPSPKEVEIASKQGGNEYADARRAFSKRCDEFSKELNDIIQIWSSRSVGLCGNKIVLNEAEKLEESFEKIQTLGRNIGIDTGIQSYYEGVPVEDICA